MSATIRYGTLAALIALVGAAPAAALHSAFVAAPNFSEEALTWCGPAVAQMALEGYPASPCSHLQADVWAEVLLNKTEASWDTDPMGMRGALLGLCPPPGTWSVYHRSAADELMFSVAYWMTRNGFPVAAVLDTSAHRAAVPAHREHWVLIKGIVTDVDPTVPGTTSVNLSHVWYTDPSPAAFGDPAVEHFVAGGDWYLDFQAVDKPASAYHGEFVAVIEPPQFRGRAIARVPLLRGRVIVPERALELAKRWVAGTELLREIKPFASLVRARPLPPLLVDKEQGGYYLVPFATEGDAAGFAVLINAYSGDFKEAGAFAPHRFLGEKEAIERAAKLLGIRRPQEASARLLYAPGAGAASRFHPVWQVETERGVAVVRPDGTARAWPRPRRPPG